MDSGAVELLVSPKGRLIALIIFSVIGWVSLILIIVLERNRLKS